MKNREEIAVKLFETIKNDIFISEEEPKSSKQVVFEALAILDEMIKKYDSSSSIEATPDLLTQAIAVVKSCHDPNCPNNGISVRSCPKPDCPALPQRS